MPKSRDLLVKEMKRSRDKAAKESAAQADARERRSETVRERVHQMSHTITKGGVHLSKEGNPNHTAAPLPRKWSAKLASDDDDNDDDGDGDASEDPEDIFSVKKSSSKNHSTSDATHEDPEHAESTDDGKDDGEEDEDEDDGSTRSGAPRTRGTPESASSKLKTKPSAPKRDTKPTPSSQADSPALSARSDKSAPPPMQVRVRPLPQEKQQPPKWAVDDVILEGLPAELPRTGSVKVTVRIPVHHLAPTAVRNTVAQHTESATTSAVVTVDYEEMHLPAHRRSAPDSARKPFAIYLEECEHAEVANIAAAPVAGNAHGHGKDKEKGKDKHAPRGSVNKGGNNGDKPAAAPLKKIDKDRVRREALKCWETLPVEELARLHALAAVDKVRYRVQMQEHEAVKSGGGGGHHHKGGGLYAGGGR